MGFGRLYFFKLAFPREAIVYKELCQHFLNALLCLSQSKESIFHLSMGNLSMILRPCFLLKRLLSLTHIENKKNCWIQCATKSLCVSVLMGFVGTCEWKNSLTKRQKRRTGEVVWKSEYLTVSRDLQCCSVCESWYVQNTKHLSNLRPLVYGSINSRLYNLGHVQETGGWYHQTKTMGWMYRYVCVYIHTQKSKEPLKGLSEYLPASW